MNESRTLQRGRPAKPIENPGMIIKSVILFLQMFMNETLAKRVVGIVLVAVGISFDQIPELAGLSKRSAVAIKSAIQNGDIESLFVVTHGGGRRGKAMGFENAIFEEVEKNNYHTRQQIADMIHEKFGISMSVSAVGKLLKKTASGG